MHDLLTNLANWLGSTRLNAFFGTTEGLIATSQSIHILAVSVVFGSGLMISLRLLGIGASGRSVSRLASTVMPWMWWSLLALLLTGLVQTVSEPVRELGTTAFWLKMGMLVCVIALNVWFGRTVRARAATWDSAATRPASARVFAVVSLLLWVAIILCGRLIAYTWQQ
jgi:hypothetical protein